MSTAFATDLIDEINSMLDSNSVLQTIDFHADKLQLSGETIKAFCPIHKDSRFRSLLVDAERHAFRCTIKTCQGYTGGSLVELYALSKDVSLLSAACALIDEQAVPIGNDWREQLVGSFLSDAEEARRQEDFTAAETLLKELVTAFPDIADARILLANVHDDMGDSQAAAEEFVRIIEHFIATDRINDAEALANDVIKRYAGNEDLRFISVKIAEELGNNDLAVERIQEIISIREAAGRDLDNVGILEKLVEKSPREPAFAIKLADLYEQQHNLRAASRQYENAAANYFDNGDTARGIELLEKVVQFNSENVKARLDLADHLFRSGNIDGAREHTFRAVNQQIDQQAFGPAVDTVNSWLKHEPDNIDARELLARIFLDQEKVNEAAKHLLDGAEIAATNKDHNRSTDLLLRAKFLTPDARALRHRLIQEFYAMGEQQRAAFEIIDLTEILFSADQSGEAVELISDGINRDVSFPLKLQMVSSLINHDLADSALENLLKLIEPVSATGTPDERAELYGLLVRVEPARQEHHEALFNALWEVSQERGADAAAESATWFIKNERPEDASAIIELVASRLESYLPAASRLFDLSLQNERLDLAGDLYQVSIQGLADKDPEAALKTANRMVEIDPGHPSASSDIAFLLAALGRSEEAADQYAGVANLLLQGGDYTTGYQYAQEAVALNPQSINALAAIAMLGREVLDANEAAQLADNLLTATRQATNRDDAATGYFTCAELYPDDDNLLKEAADALERLDHPEAVAQVYARQAMKLSVLGNWEGACEKLKLASQNAPAIPQIHEQFGEACRVTGDTDGAARAFANAAIAYVQLGDLENAARCTNSSQLAGPQSPESWEALFRAAIAIEQLDLAGVAAEHLSRMFAEKGPPPTTARWTREWVRLAPDNANAHKALGIALLAVDQAENAVEALSTAAAIFLRQRQDADAVDTLQISVSRNIATANDREILSTVLGRQEPNSNLHNLAGGLLGQSMLHTGELESARALANDLRSDTIASDLWSDIARAETEPARAVSAWVHAAESLRLQNNLDGAITALEGAVSLGSATYEVHELLADLLAETQRFDEAFPHQLQVLQSLAETDDPRLSPLLMQLRTIHGENIDALIDIARALLAAGRTDLAITDLETAAIHASASNNAAALITVCGLNETVTRESGILTRARADALMGMENEQQALEWVIESGRNLMTAGKADESRQMAERWISLAPGDLEAYRLYQEACELSGKSEDALEARFKIARLLTQNKDFALAVDELEHVLKQQPSSDVALKMKADLEKRLDRKEDASQTFAQLGGLLVNKGAFLKALAAYRESLSLNPQNAEVLWHKAELLRDTEGVAAAMPIYRKWANVRRETVSPGQWIEDINVLLPMAPTSTALLRELSDALIQAGRQAEARPHLEKLAQLLEDEGDYQRAAETHEILIANAAAVEPEHYLKISQLFEKADFGAQAQGYLRDAATGYQRNGNAGQAAEAFGLLLKMAGDTALPEDMSTAATAYAEAGDADTAATLISKCLVELDKQSGSRQRKEELLAQALSIAPLNLDYVSRRMSVLPPARAMTEGLNVSKEMQAAGHSEDAITVLTQVIALAPHDMSLRQEIFEPLRKTGNQDRLRSELLALASDALAAGDADAALTALDEAVGLATSAQHYRTLAELNERARRFDEAAEQFATAAVMFADNGKSEQAIAAINRAVSAKPLAIPANSMAHLVQKIGPEIHNIAREQLRTALTARRQKHSQTLTLALLESMEAQQADDLLKAVFTLGGSTFLVGIARSRVDQLLEDGQIPEALKLAETVNSIAPDAPDAWFMAAQVNHKAGNPKDARRSAMEAARLFRIAGAVIEEESCYQEALSAEPSNTGVKAEFAEYLVREHRPAEAVALLSEIVNSAEAAGNNDLVLETLNRAVQIAPANPDLREKLAVLLEKLAPDSAIDNWLEAADVYKSAGKHVRARRIFEHVLTLNKRNEKALYGLLADARESANMPAAAKFIIALAEAKASHRNVGEACRLLQAHLEIDPDNLEVLEHLSDLSGASRDSEVFITTTRALARKFQKAGDNKSALHHYEKLLESTPRDVHLLTTLIDCTAAVGMPEKGAEYARLLLSVAHETEDPERIRLAAATILHYDDQDAVAHNDLAEALLSLNRVSEAVTECLRAAELFEGSGNPAGAFACYRRVTQISPSTVQAWRRLGEISLTSGDLETARMSVSHLLEISSGADGKYVSPLLARLLAAMPDDQSVHEVALKFYRQNNDLDNAAGEYMWLSNHAKESGNLQEAEDYLVVALKMAPENTQLKNVHYDLIRQMGRLEELQLRLRQEAEDHVKAGQTEEAISVLKELADITPGQLGIHRDLAKMFMQEGRQDEALEQDLEVVKLLLNRSDLEEARESAEALIAKYPDKTECREMIADLLVETSYPDLAARYYRAAAEVHIEGKKYEPAISLLRRAVDVRPQWVDARTLLAETCNKAKRPDEAFDAWLGLLPLLLETGEYAEAADTLGKLSKLKPDSPEVREQLAELYERTGKRDEHTKILHELAELYDKAGNTKKALECYRKLAAAVPDDPAVLTRYIEMLALAEPEAENLSKEYTRLADVLARQGDYEGAFQTYEQVLGLTPDDTTARSRYATFLLTRGNRKRALAEMRRLATLYTERKEPAAAVEVLNAALTISPRDADICLALATAQEEAGMHEDARVTYARASAILASTAAVKGIDTYRRILTQDEQNTAVRLRLVELLIKSGDKMEAAREARILAEIHINRGEMAEAKNAYRIVDDCEPESLEEIRQSIQRDSYDPSLQYVHYVRLGNALFDTGDIDNALDAYRTARSLHDDSPELIQKCIDCVTLIAPEVEAVPDYLLMAEKLQLLGEMYEARKAYDQVRLIDPFNNDARCGLESIAAAERQQVAIDVSSDDLVLKTSRTVNKRVALMDLLMACQDAARDPADSQKLGK